MRTQAATAWLLAGLLSSACSPESTPAEGPAEDAVANDTDAGDDAEPGPTQCTSNAACALVIGVDELAPCERAVCQDGACVVVIAPDGTLCQPADACQVAAECQAGACAGTEDRDCDDGNPCTEDSCDAALGCVSAPVQAALPCDDGDLCTAGDACKPGAGTCAGQPACECESEADCQPYEDGNLCNGTLTCSEGLCVVAPETVVSCDPAEGECAVVSCVPATGQCSEEVLDCDDGNACTIDSCEGGACVHAFDPACGCEGAGCPPTGEPGDSLVLLDSTGTPVETVGVEITPEGYVITCGGFGMDSFKLDAGAAQTLTKKGHALSRCQNIAVGPLLDEDTRLILAAHHGDGYVSLPGIHSVALDLITGALTSISAVTELGTSFEGVELDKDTLWVAAHEAGVRRYHVNIDGSLSLVDTLAGFDNAYRLWIEGNHVYVADGGGGLKIVERASGVIVGEASSVGFAKDVAVTGTMAVLAVSTLGVQAYDVSDPTSPEVLNVQFTYGTAIDLALLAGGTRLAVANWDDIAIVDVSHPDAFKVLAYDRATTAPQLPRNLGVAAAGDVIVAGEWLGLGVLRWYEGLIGPEIDYDRASIQIGGVLVGQTAKDYLTVFNRGWLPLEVSVVPSNPSAWVASPDAFTLEPGDDALVTIDFLASSAGTFADSLTLVSNDPDEPSVGIAALGNPDSGKLEVGDPLTPAFDFLDVDSPDGEQDVSKLKGNILVLAYFATF